MNSSSSIDLKRPAVSYWHSNINFITVILKRNSKNIERARYVPHGKLTCL